MKQKTKNMNTQPTIKVQSTVEAYSKKMPFNEWIKYIHQLREQISKTKKYR